MPLVSSRAGPENTTTKYRKLCRQLTLEDKRGPSFSWKFALPESNKPFTTHEEVPVALKQTLWAGEAAGVAVEGLQQVQGGAASLNLSLLLYT